MLGILGLFYAAHSQMVWEQPFLLRTIFPVKRRKGLEYLPLAAPYSKTEVFTSHPQECLSRKKLPLIGFYIIMISTGAWVLYDLGFIIFSRLCKSTDQQSFESLQSITPAQGLSVLCGHAQLDIVKWLLPANLQYLYIFCGICNCPDTLIRVLL